MTADLGGFDEIEQELNAFPLVARDVGIYFCPDLPDLEAQSS